MENVLDFEYNVEKDWREKVHEVIFEADTTAGKIFDVGLLISILASVVVVSLESVSSIDAEYHSELVMAEWFFTILFSIEYILRIVSVKKPTAYMTSLFGIVDLLAVVPTYLSLFIPGAHNLLVIRALRLLRVFRVFKLGRYLGEAAVLKKAISQSKSRIIVFLSTVFVLCILSGAAMYMFEGPENGFTSIPQSIYWAIVTLTSTGYGDTVPLTALGKSVAVFIMIMGYSLIIVPTGILTNEIVKTGPVSTQACPSCSREGHDIDANNCKFCGSKL
jgi:voltage-gated potassium channel